MEVAVIASGSNGNVSMIKTNDDCFLIDDGISLKKLKERLATLNLELDSVSKVFITHEHIDHVYGLKVLAKNTKINFYLSQGTYNGLNYETKQNLINRCCIIKGNNSMEIGKSRITFLVSHHDCNEPLGFVIEEEDKKLVYITDTGYVDSKYYSLISNADMYIMESNYDVELLWTSTRPFELKKRIDGDHGHMSNEASAVLLAHLIGNKTKRVVMAHISEDCNYYLKPELIVKAHKKVYEEYGLDVSNIDFIVANRDNVTGVYSI